MKTGKSIYSAYARLSLIFVLVAGLTGIVNECQGQSEQPFKKATKILIESDLSGLELYNRFGRYLAENGFSIETSNPDFLNLRTGPRSTTKFNYNYTISATVTGNVIMLTMQWKVNSAISHSDYYDWRFNNTNMGTADGIVYNNVMDYISKFEKNKVMYQ